MRMFPSIVLQFFALCFALNGVYGQNNDQNAKYVLDATPASRSLIRTGVFRLVANKNHDGETSQISIFHAFDNDQLLYRTDQTWIDSEKKEIIQLGQLIQNTKSRISLAPGDTTISITSINKPTPNWGKIFDFRAVGLAYYGDIERKQSFDKIWENYKQFQISKVEQLEDGKTKVVWSKGQAVVFDEGRDFWPVSLILELDPNVKIVGEVELTQINNRWVPKKYFVKQIVGDTLMSFDLEFDWQSVNEEVDPKYFDYETFKKSKGMKVVDFGIPGQPVTIEIVGNDMTGIKPVNRKINWIPWTLGGFAFCLIAGRLFLNRHGKK